MKTVQALLHRLGIRATYSGFHYLTYAIVLSLEDDSYLHKLTTALYPAIAAQFHTTPACVERSMRSLLDVFWHNGNRAYFDEIVGYAMPSRPYVGEFIGIMVVYLRVREE